MRDSFIYDDYMSEDILQHTATHCNTEVYKRVQLHNSAKYDDYMSEDTLQHTATHCNTLQHTATLRSTKGCNCATVLNMMIKYNECMSTYTTLQHTATNYTTLQHTATYYILTSKKMYNCVTLINTIE